MNRYLMISLTALAACRPSAKQAPTTLAGTAVLEAPIVGAHVRVTMKTSSSSEVVGESTTDEKGNFEIPLFAADGTLLIEVLGDQGGSTAEPISGKPLDLSYNDRFANLLAGVGLGTRVDGIIIGPWSTLLTDRALWDMGFNKTSAAKALVSAAQLFQNHFGGLDFIHSLPLDPASVATHGLSSGAVHGFVTSALATMGNDLSDRLGLSEGNLINTISLTQWLSDDVSADGHFDGIGKNGPIAVVDQSVVGVEFTRAFLGAALGTFATSAKNVSGVGLSDLTAIVNAITSDTSVLYGNSSSIAVSQGAGPRIVISSPLGSTTLKDQVLIVGSANTTAGVAGVEIYLDEVQVGGGQRQSVNEIDWAQTVAVTDGFHIVKVKSIDSTGQGSELSVTFSSDATPPTITFDSCRAFDDRNRSHVPSVDNLSQQVTWYNPAPPDSGCTSDTLSSKDQPYVFHSFQQLAEAAATSSLLTLVPHDSGPVVTADSDLLFKAEIYRGSTQIGQTLKVQATAGIATREIPISADAFGAALLDVSSKDTLELRLTAIDAEGNTGTLSLYFVLDLLPSPLQVVPVSIGSSSPEHIDHYSFAAGNAASAFDQSILLPAGIYVVQRYTIANVSDRSTAFSIPLDPGFFLNAQYVEWNGFTAGDLIEVGTANKQVTASTQDSLPSIDVPARYPLCNNTEPDIHLKRADLVDPVNVDTFKAGVENCENSNGILTGAPVETTSSQWQVVVQDQSGTRRFVSPSGDYTIAVGETLTVSIGFTQPSFSARTSTSCTPTVDSMGYNSPFAPHQYSDFFYAGSYSQSSVSLQLGIPTASQLLIQEDESLTNWSGLGWVDCSGVACGGTGCRTANDAFLLRVEGGIYNEDQQIWTSGTTSYWLRNAYREYASIALSRLTMPHSFSVTGNASVTSASHLATNPQAYDFTFQLPVEQFNVDYSSTYSISQQPILQSAVFTKGTLP